MNVMNETKILKDQQKHFIFRLKDGLENLHPYEKPGKFGEIKTISGKDLKDIRKYCWNMADKFKKCTAQEVFKNNMKGKLGEKVVERCLGNDLVSRVRYDVIPESGDGKVDLTVNSYHTIGIQVKTRYGNSDEVKWMISSEEIDKNKVIVCVLLHKEDQDLEEFDEFKPEYKPIIAGFLPTDFIQTMINKDEIEKEINNGKYLVKLSIDDLWHGMGLESYMKTLIDDPELDIQSGYSCIKENNYQGAVENYTKAINKAIDIEPIPNCCADAYEGRGISYSKLGDAQEAKNDLEKAHALYLDQGRIDETKRVFHIIANLITHPVANVPPKPHLDYKWNCLHTLEGHSKPVRSITANRDGQFLVSGSADRTQLNYGSRVQEN